MKWYIFLLLLLFLVSPPGFGDVILTDQEAMEIDQKLISTKSRLEMLEEIMTMQRDLLSSQETMFSQLETYCEKRLIARRIDRVKDFGLGVLVGVLFGGIYYAYNK